MLILHAADRPVPVPIFITSVAPNANVGVVADIAFTLFVIIPAVAVNAPVIPSVPFTDVADVELPIFIGFTLVLTVPIFIAPALVRPTLVPIFKSPVNCVSAIDKSVEAVVELTLGVLSPHVPINTDPDSPIVIAAAPVPISIAAGIYSSIKCF